MRLAALLGAILALVSAPAASGGEWALQTFVKVAQSDGSELLAELRHPCGASVEETTRSFWWAALALLVSYCEPYSRAPGSKDFDIAAPDCGLLAEFVEGLSRALQSGPLCWKRRRLTLLQSQHLVGHL